MLASIKDARDKAQQAAYRQYLGEVVKAIELYKTGGGNMDDLSIEDSPFIDDVIDSTGVGNFIKKSNTPSFVESKPSIINTGGGVYGCGDDNQSDYLIVFIGTNTNLNFQRFYTGGAQYGEIFYCVSPSMK